MSAYRPLPGVADELVTADGTLRPLWQPMIDHLQSLTDEGLTRATGRADQYLRDSGVFYRQYGSGQSVERPWPLSHIPVLIDEADWAELTPALTLETTPELTPKPAPAPTPKSMPKPTP